MRAMLLGKLDPHVACQKTVIAYYQAVGKAGLPEIFGERGKGIIHPTKMMCVGGSDNPYGKGDIDGYRSDRNYSQKKPELFWRNL